MKRVPWNKGKKGVQIAWNKGLTKEIDLRIRRYASKLSKSRKGMKLSEEHKRNIGKSIKGRPAPNKGIPTSEKTRKKLSKILSGKGNPFYGRTHTQDTKLKISNSRKGKCVGENNHNYVGNIIEPHKKEIIKRYIDGESASKLGRFFGISNATIVNYLEKWNIPRRKGAFNFKGLLKCKDGHKVRSYPEIQIDNFLFENGINHEVEKSFNMRNKQFKCDFYLPEINMYIEYWGIYHNKNYVKRKEKKLKIYEKLKLNLFSIEWYEDPIKKLNFLIPSCAKNQSNLFSFDKTH